MTAAEDADFERLTGVSPLPWQQRLFDRLLSNDVPSACDVPTGLGKTSAIALWLLALAYQAAAGAVRLPRRLVYVVNRRTVVDQATDEVERIRKVLEQGCVPHVAAALRTLPMSPDSGPVAVSTLRGELADNAEWRQDPARAAVIIGTVDMIGSRLLFGGYGCGFKSKPLHAGFIGQDTLILHDEAHLEPAFQQLLSAIHDVQRVGNRRDYRPLRLMALTATSRHDVNGDVLRIDDRDREHPLVHLRVHARKGLACTTVEEKGLVDQIVRCALTHRDSGQAILVFVRNLDVLDRVASQLSRSHAVRVLTGTMRGLERQALAADDVFRRFRPDSGAGSEGTVYLVATSAGEVGVNISADHLVCDLTPFDSMAQRLGRVNRFGGGDASIDVVYARRPAEDERYETARTQTLSLLMQLPEREGGRRDASPYGLGQLDQIACREAFTPSPVTHQLTDVLLDRWALTSVRGRLPGRPAIADWLHGVEAWEPPEMQVAWREDVDQLTQRFGSHVIEELLEDYPLKPHELLRERVDRVLKHVGRLRERHGEKPVWLIHSDGSVDVSLTLNSLAEKDKEELGDCTLLLPPSAGGMSARAGHPTGVLDGSADVAALLASLDVADQWCDETGPRRQRIWDDEQPLPGMRLVRVVDTRPDADDEASEDVLEPGSRRLWKWYTRPRSSDDDGSRSALREMELDPHLERAAAHANTIVSRLGLDPLESGAVTFAARWHDTGKRRAMWQRALGNLSFPDKVLAKSRQPGRIDVHSYRHEFGSMLDVLEVAEFKLLPDDARDLALHLIAAHHGRSRPHFHRQEAFDPDYPDERTAGASREALQRFGRLQRRYGRWGLAYLESLVRAVDALASRSEEVA